MIDNDLNESGSAFPEFDERGARHYPTTWSVPLGAWKAAVAMDRRDAAFRLAFRRCGGILPRFAGCQVYSSAWYSGLTHAEVASYSKR